MESAEAKLHSYRVTMVRQERVGEGMGPEGVVAMAFQQPARLSLRWTGEVHSGQVIISQNGRIHGHRGGLLSFFDFSLDAADSRVEKDAHHAIADAPISHIIQVLKENITRAQAEKKVTLRVSNDKWREARCIRIDASFAESDPPYFAARALVYVDPTSKLPLAFQVYDSPDKMLEQIEYQGVEVNPKFGPNEFNLGP